MFRAITGALVGMNVSGGKEAVSYPSLIGWVSLWMIPIGGTCGLLLDYINETKLKTLPMAIQSFIGMNVIVAVEFMSGLFFNVLLALGLWSYLGLKFQFLGQISLLFAILFFLFTPYTFWLGDILRYSLGIGEKPRGMFPYYAALVTDFIRKK